MQGVVNDAYEAVVALSLQGPEGQAQDIEAVIDTGYSGFLTLPKRPATRPLGTSPPLRENSIPTSITTKWKITRWTTTARRCGSWSNSCCLCTQ